MKNNYKNKRYVNYHGSKVKWASEKVCGNKNMPNTKPKRIRNKNEQCKKDMKLKISFNFSNFLIGLIAFIFLPKIVPIGLKIFIVIMLVLCSFKEGE